MAADKIPADLLLRHGRVITMDPERRILADGAVAIRDGRIVAVGPDREVAPAVESTAVRELDGALVHPGFVDGHVHTSADIIRGMLPKLSGDWTPVERPFGAAKTEELEYLTAMLTCMEMVANGTTMFSDTGSTRRLDVVARAIATVGLRGIPGYSIGDIPSTEGRTEVPTTEENLALLEAQLERYPFHGGGRVRCAVTLSGMGTASDRLLTEAKALADRRKVRMIMHQSWEEEEVAKSLTQYGRRPVEHLADLGMLGPNLTLVHMIRLDAAEVQLVAESGTSVVHCPAAATRRSMGAIRAGKHPELLRAGANVALGSDGLSGKRDLARQMYLAATLHREFRGDLPIITAEQALEMATLNGARALGVEHEVGSLEVGKRADLVIHSLDRPESHPRYRNPVDQLVFIALAQAVDTVLVDGEPILDHARFTRFDAQDVFARIDAAGATLEAEIAYQDPAAWPVLE